MPRAKKMNWRQVLQFMQQSYAQNVHGITYKTSDLSKISVSSNELSVTDNQISEVRERFWDRIQIAKNWKDDPYGDGSDCGTANEASLTRLVLSILLWGKEKENIPVPFRAARFSRTHGMALMDKSDAYDNLSDVILAELGITDIPRVYQAID